MLFSLAKKQYTGGALFTTKSAPKFKKKKILQYNKIILKQYAIYKYNIICGITKALLNTIGTGSDAEPH